MKKKGFSQIDWIMSLAIFLMYLAWFFSFIKPLADTEQPTDALLARVRDGLQVEGEWGIEKTPLFIRSNISSTKEPIVLSFPYNWRPEKMAFSDNKSFFFDEDRLLFLTDVKQGMNLLWLVHSSENYDQSIEITDLYATDSYATINDKDFKVDFADGILDEVTYKGAARMYEFNLSLNNVAITEDDVNNIDTNVSGFVAKYKIETDVFNHTAYVMSGNTRIINYITLNQPREVHNLSFSASLHNYTHYYIDGLNKGKLNYNESNCLSKWNNYAMLYDSKGGVTIITEDNSNVSMCFREDRMNLQVSFGLKNETRYDIIMHEGDYNDTLKYVEYYAPRFGIAENITSLSIDRLNSINATNYGTLKQRWGFPNKRDFAFYISINNTDIYTYVPKEPGSMDDVFVKEWDDYILGKYGNKHKCTVRVKGW
ncbi:MAG: hypothetical protein GY861_28475 [bacterium]|nr:hypothetical protein [bacterium]